MPEFPCPSANLAALRDYAVANYGPSLVGFVVELLEAMSGDSLEIANGANTLLTENRLSTAIASIPALREPTFREFVKSRFEPDVLQRLKRTGRAPYEYSLQRHVLPAIGDVCLSEITFETIQVGIVQTMLDAGYAVHTAKEARRVANTVFTHAVRVKVFSGTPPTVGTRFPVTRRKRTHALTMTQATAILQLLENPFRTMALLSMTTSMNLAEECALRWRRINLSCEPLQCDGEMIPANSAAVRETVHRGVFGTPRTEQRRRFVTLPESAVLELQALRAASRHPRPNDIVFSTRTGRPYLLSYLHGKIKPAGISLGLSWLSWSCFRNTYATLAEHLGIALSDRQAQMGLATTWMMERYPCPDTDLQRVAAETIAKSIA